MRCLGTNAVGDSIDLIRPNALSPEVQVKKKRSWSVQCGIRVARLVPCVLWPQQHGTIEGVLVSRSENVAKHLRSTFYVFARVVFSRVAWSLRQILALLYYSVISVKKIFLKQIKKKKFVSLYRILLFCRKKDRLFYCFNLSESLYQYGRGTCIFKISYSIILKLFFFFLKISIHINVKKYLCGKIELFEM